MPLKPAQLAASLKQGLKPVYLLAGEEPLLIQESLDAIRTAARKAGYAERETLEVGPGFQWSRLEESSASLSLFASRRLIELHAPRGLGGGRNKAEDDDAEPAASGGSAHEGAKLLQRMAEKPAPDTLLIVVAGALDRKQQSSAWVTALERAGVFVYAWPVRPDELTDWIAARFKSAGLEADAEAVALLAERTEGNLLACAQDLSKMKLLFAGQRIGVEQVRAAVADSAHFESFDLIDKMLAGDAAGVTRGLARLREQGVAAPALLGAVTYSLRLWATAAMAYARSKSVESALAEAGLFGARARPYEAALRRHHGMSVLRALARCARIDRRAKSTLGKEEAWEDLLDLLLSAAGTPLPRVAASA